MFYQYYYETFFYEKASPEPITATFQLPCWKCDHCGKEKKYTQEEIDRKKKPWPDPQKHDRDYYVSCPFCQKGEMEPPTFVSPLGAFNKK